MKNKGFVFVETIIVITVLTVALLSIYSSFLNILTSEKRRATYNDTEYLYRTYYLEDFMSSLNLKQYIANNLTDKSIAEFNCSNDYLYNLTKNDLTNNTVVTDESEVAKRSFCETIINTKKLNIKHIYITKYDVSDLKKCTSKDGNVTCTSSNMDTLRSVSTNFIYYLRTLSSTSDDEGDYRLIVEYEEIEYDNTLTKDPKDNDKCENTYVIQGDKCIKSVTKNYYSNVKLVIQN